MASVTVGEAYRYLRAMLIALAMEGESEAPLGKGARLRELVAKRFDVCNGGTLAGQLSARSQAASYNLSIKSPRYIQGPTANGGGVLPLVTVDFQLEPEPMFLHLQVVLCVKHDSSLKLSGFRYESPNPPGQEHGFYHAQPVRVVRGDPPELLDVPEWMSDETPTFPLKAENWETLCRAMLESLYGTSRVREIEESMKHYMRF